MKKLLLFCIIAIIPFASFGRSVSEIRQLLVGEWVASDSDKNGYTKFNSDGTVSEMIFYAFFEDELLRFNWSVTSESSIHFSKPGRSWNEPLGIIDRNTITISNTTYTRRGSKNSSAVDGVNPSTRPAVRQSKSNLLWQPKVSDAAQFTQAVTHPFGIAHDEADLTIASFEAFCAERSITYSATNSSDRHDFQITNRRVSLFGQEFVVRLTVFDSKSNPFRYQYSATPVGASAADTVERMAGELKAWGINLTARIVRRVDGTEEREGYSFRLGQGWQGDLYPLGNRLILFIDRIN